MPGLIILSCEECGSPFKKEDIDEYIECLKCGHTYFNPNWAKKGPEIIERVVTREVYQQPTQVMCMTTGAVGYHSISTDMAMPVMGYPFGLQQQMKIGTSDDI